MAELTDLVPTGTTDFDNEVRAVFDEWQTAIENNIDGVAAVTARVGEMEAGTFFAGLGSPIVPDAAIISLSMDKISVVGSLSDGVAWIYRAASGWSLELIAGVVGGDTYQARFSEGGPTGFLEAFLATSSEALGGGGGSLLTPETAKVSAVTSSLNNLGDVSGVISIGPTHKVHVLSIVGPTTIELVNMDDASVEFLVDLVVSNPSNYTITWPSSLEWVNGTAPSTTTTTRIALGTHTGGASYFGAEAWSSGGVTGTYCLCSTDEIPDGAVLCDGSELVRTATPRLYAKLGTSEGDGDGVTTYNLPDWRGYAGRGWDNGAGRDPDASTRSGGDTVGSTQGSQNKSHNHSGSIGFGGNHRHGFGAGFCSSNGNGSNIWGSGCSRDGTHYTDYDGSHAHALSIYSSGGSEARMINKSWAVAIWL